MALVDYASSSDSEAHPTSPGKRKRESSSASGSTSASKRVKSNELPPLPASFHDLYATAARSSTQDDPSLHEGRTRVVPHQEGYWPSHVYLEWLPSEDHHKLLTNIVDAVTKANPDSQPKTLLTSSLLTTLPLHISLSAPLSISGDRKDAFLEKLLAGLPSLSPFNVRLSELSWVSNNERTRWFLVVRCEQPDRDELNELLRYCNHVCKDFGLSQLYADPSVAVDDGSIEMPYMETSKKARRVSRRKSKERESLKEELSWIADFSDHFHFSIAWSLKEQEGIHAIESGMKDLLDQLRAVEVMVDSVKVKIGNVVTSLPFDDGRHRDKRRYLG